MDIKRAVEKCYFFTHNVFEYKGFKKAIIGISGGLDSAVVAAICCKALGKENVYGYMLPCGHQYDIEDSVTVCNTLGINQQTIDIQQLVEPFRLVEENILFDKQRIANIKARVRMIVLYDMSMKHNGLVVGTSNLTELMLGYFTLHGDGACALEPIGHLFKTEVREVAKELGIPEEIITKAPSAGLWEGQTDEEEIGCSYEIIDAILRHRLLIPAESPEDITEIIDAISIELETPIKTVDKILTRMQNNSFKLKSPTIMRR